MQTGTMSRVLTAATIENLEDLWAEKQGLRTAEQMRRVTVMDAFADSGATLLSLPAWLIQQLGLTPRHQKHVVSSNGTVTEATVYGTVRLTIQGRDCPTDVIEVPDNVPVLVGQIPLEYLDLVLDLRNRCLIANPAHGGEHVFELY
jgi:Aspartyl protease